MAGGAWVYTAIGGGGTPPPELFCDAAIKELLVSITSLDLSIERCFWGETVRGSYDGICCCGSAWRPPRGSTCIPPDALVLL